MKNEVNNLEVEHLSRINRIFTIVLIIHIPVACLFAWYFNTNPAFALAASVAITSLPVFLTFFSKQPKLTSYAQAIGIMFFSGLLIHLSKGMIETHFHIFVSIACMTVFAKPLVILTAAATIAVHHVGFFFLLPESVFNYEASFNIVIIHAIYVVLETFPCMWIARKFETYIIKQGEVIQQIDQIFSMMNRAINDLSNTNQIAAKDNDIQSEVVTKTAEVVSEISMMASSTVSNAEDSKKISEETTKRAQVGLQSIKELTSSFDNIKNSNLALADQIENITTQLNEIVSSMQEIADKTSVINDIVFQTKLLSFNASVESARAGEHGKGFSVVAEEVGNLAQMSGNSSKEINDLININVHKVKTIADNTQKAIAEIIKNSRDSISDGEVKTTQTARNFDELTAFLTNLNQNVSEITRATHEQGTGIERINSAISELEAVNERSNQTRKTSQEVSQELNELALKLGELVKRLA